MYCEKCGAQVSSQEQFCSQCGHPVKQAPQELNDAPRQENEVIEVEHVSNEESIEREQARRDVIHGSLWFFGGVIVTVISYMIAVGGGTYFITWGAVVIGGFQLLRGLVTYFNNGGVPSGVRNAGIAVVTTALIVGYFVYQDQQGKLSIFDLEKGDCFSVRGAEVESEHSAVDIFSCSSTDWDYRVLSAIEVSSSSTTYPKESFFDDKAESGCSASADTFFFPTPESWAEGDRTVLCVAGR